jgi:hypothetical protein
MWLLTKRTHVVGGRDRPRWIILEVFADLLFVVSSVLEGLESD